MHGHSTNSNSNKKKIIFAIYSPLSLITLLLWIVNICKYNNSNEDLLVFPQWLPFWSGLKPSCSSKAAEHRILLSRSARCRLSADVEDRVPAVFLAVLGGPFEVVMWSYQSRWRTMKKNTKPIIGGKLVEVNPIFWIRKPIMIHFRRKTMPRNGYRSSKSFPESSKNKLQFCWSNQREEKLHAVVARSTFPSQNVQNTPGSDHFWKLTCRKIARRCGAKHISKSTCTKHAILGPLLEVEMLKKCTPLWREAHFKVKSVKNSRSRTVFGSWHVEKVHAVVARSTFPSQKCKNLRVRSTFGRSDVVLRGTRKGLCTLSNVSKTRGFVAVSKTISWEGLHFGASDLQVCWDDFAWQVQHFVWPGITSSWQARYFSQVEWKNHKMHCYEAVSSPLNFLFLKDVSQNCFVFEVVNFENWGSLAELFRFWCCQVQKLRKSRRVVSFLTL